MKCNSSSTFPTSGVLPERTTLCTLGLIANLTTLLRPSWDRREARSIDWSNSTALKSTVISETFGINLSVSGYFPSSKRV